MQRDRQAEQDTAAWRLWHARLRIRAGVHLLEAGRLIQLDPDPEAERAALWCFRWASRLSRDAVRMADGTCPICLHRHDRPGCCPCVRVA